jgi:hypothetical protein
MGRKNMKSSSEMIDIQSDNSSGQHLLSFLLFVKENISFHRVTLIMFSMIVSMRMSETDRVRRVMLWRCLHEVCPT